MTKNILLTQPGKALAIKVAGLVCSLLLLSTQACSAFPLTREHVETPSPVPFPGLDELRFKDPETGRRFQELNSGIHSMVDDTWSTTPYHLSGNFYEAAWCRGAGIIPGCRITDLMFERPDQQTIMLSTLYYEQNLPEVFGLEFQAHWVPKETGWGALFGFSEGGSSVLGEGWQVIFRDYSTTGGTPGSIVTLGWSYSYSPYETPIVISSGQALRADLAPYLAGPQAMRNIGLANIQALARQVNTEISNHHVSTCDLQPYENNGIPPACLPRPMTAEEEETELKRAEKFFAEQQQLLRDHYQEMYAAWMSAFPVDQFWGPATIH